MKILVAGDFCPRSRLAKAIEDERYEDILGQVKGYTESVDYSIVNLECPVVSSLADPIVKHGSNLKCSPKGVECLKYAGFNCATLANNHFLDYGKKGVENTLNAAKNNAIDTVGGGISIVDASAILYKKIAGNTLAIINCCEHEFSIATDSTPGSNPLNPIQQYYSIQEAKKHADYVLIIVHGGHEFFQLPSLRMQETYRFFIDVGADAVVNHHQHCFSGYEEYNGKPIFYGLGNFCFDKNGMHSGLWTEGFFVIINFGEADITYCLFPYSQCSEEAGVKMLKDDAYGNRILELNSIISNPERLKKALEEYYSSNANIVSSFFSPIGNKYYQSAIKRGWAPSLVTKQRKIGIENMVCCESHCDKLKYYLNKRLK